MIYHMIYHFITLAIQFHISYIKHFLQLSLDVGIIAECSMFECLYAPPSLVIQVVRDV